MAASAARTFLSRFNSQQGLCIYCEVALTESNVTLEHVIPRCWSRGGDGRSKNGGGKNLVLACEQCNSLKSVLESHITNQMGSHLGLVERAALFMLGCMKRPHKNPAFKLRFTRMASQVMEAADAHHQRHRALVPKQHRERYL